MNQTVFIHDNEWVKEAKVEKMEPLKNELEHFMQYCMDGQSRIATGEDGINALKVALASIESYKTKAVVKVRSLFSQPLIQTDVSRLNHLIKMRAAKEAPLE
jgi:UDP-N-acetylglucosamine 3-dehydrogenase